MSLPINSLAVTTCNPLGAVTQNIKEISGVTVTVTRLRSGYQIRVRNQRCNRVTENHQKHIYICRGREGLFSALAATFSQPLPLIYIFLVTSVTYIQKAKKRLRNRSLGATGDGYIGLHPVTPLISLAISGNAQ